MGSLDEKSDNMKVLVTGGAGFIGSSLCRVLLAKGHAVTCLDNFSSSSRENIQSLKNTPGLTLIEKDVQSPLIGKYDEIYHFAATASPSKYLTSPIETSLTIVLGTLNALKLASETGAKILLASTSEIYGDPEISPQPETYNGNVDPTSPRGCYVEAKRYAESLAMDFYREHKTDIRIARIFNAYGPGMAPEDGRVISTFLRQASMNQPLTIYGNGTQTRSFCYIDDLIDGLLSLMNSTINGPVNLGNPEEISILDLSKMIHSLTSSQSSLSFVKLPHAEPTRRCPDIKKASSFGWVPKTSLKDGLIKTISITK
jgi:UDP-glucuronate decarboxylase